MFTLHERTRLLLCRTGFLLLCLAPTLFVAAAAVRYRSFSYIEARREEWCAVLSDKLGLEVQIGRLSYPLWNTALLEEVVLLDPETNREVLRTRYVEVSQAEGRWYVVAGQPEVNGEALPLLAELINHRLLKGQVLKLAPLDFEARELTFRSADHAQTFEQVVAEMVTIDDGKRISVRFRRAGVAAEAPAELVIARRRGDRTASTTCRLSTSGSTVPCSTLLPLLPWVKELGENAAFQGDVSLEQSHHGPLVDITGNFFDVDLDRLLSRRFPHHKLTGIADISFEPLTMENGTIVKVKGTLQSRVSGRISRSLLEASRRWLDLTPQEGAPLGADPLVRYSHLAFGFQLDEEGLSLRGDADPARDGVIMASAQSDVLLAESDSPVVAPAQFIRALSPQSELQVPATREAKSLFDLLPLPALVPLNDADRPSARNLRLRNNE